MFLPHPLVKFSIVVSLRDREVACSASERQGLNFESCVWRTVSSQLSHHPQEVPLTQFSLYVHKNGLKPSSFHFVSKHRTWFVGMVGCSLCDLTSVSQCTIEEFPAAFVVFLDTYETYLRAQERNTKSFFSMGPCEARKK